MKRLVVAAVAVSVLMGVGMAGAQEAQPAGDATQERAVKRQTVCPVMGGTVNTNLFVDHDGKRIYVCCKGCIGELKKNAAAYITKLEKDGVTLDKTPVVDEKKK